LNKLLRTVTALAARGLSALGDKLGEWRDGGWTPAQGEINKGMRDRLAAIKQESDTAAETEIKHGIETSATEAALMSGPTKEQAAAYDKENKDRLASMAAEDQARLSDQQKSSDLERSMAEQRAKQKQEYTDKKTKDAEEKKKQQDEKMRDAIAARRELLQDAVARGEGAQERIDSARTGREYKNVMAAEREQKRKDDRENKLADIALDNAGRRKLNKREEALLAGIGDKRAAEDAKKELAKMDAEAKKATIAAAASLSNIERDIKGVLVMKGN
jgi:hypothetical protein